MNYSLIFRTVVHLKATQVVFQIKNRLTKPKLRSVASPASTRPTTAEASIGKAASLDNGIFTFLNLSSAFKGWNDTERGMLWAYNLNYMDWLLQEKMTSEEGSCWIDRFIEGIPENTVGLDPYPIALRTINWIKFIAAHRAEIDAQQLQKWNDSLYSQVLLLEKKLEYHLLGNHLLEDAYALLIASVHFSDRRLYRKASRLLTKQLEEQTLADGAHYEQSPMYHCILLDRLLDCYNFSESNMAFGESQTELNSFLRHTAEKMLGHLQEIVYRDGTIPLLNDSAQGIAPSPAEIFDYARRLGIAWKPQPLKESGYRRMTTARMEAIVDIGDIAASYQPGHSHADTFNYELRVDGQPAIIDSGISTYDKTPRRQLERSTEAHNTVTIGERNSSEVWGGFRVGRRAKVRIEEDSALRVRASHNGFGSKRIHSREFEMADCRFTVHDTVRNGGNAKSYLHFAPGISVESSDSRRIVTSAATIEIDGADKVEIATGKASTEYNRFHDIKIAVIHFSKDIKYSIKI